MIKAIIFDVDGTLSETEEIHRKAFNQAFGIHGLSWHWDRDKYRRLLEVTGGKERIRHFMATHPGDRPLGDDADRFIRQIHGTKTEVYTQLVASGAAELRPGVRELIAAAQDKGIRLAIATTTSMPNVEALLLSAFHEQGADMFEVICAGDSVAAKKPAPDIYEATVEQLRLKSSDCVAIEDSRNGLLSADAAGIATMVTPSIYTEGQCFDEAELTLSDLSEDATVVAQSSRRRRQVNAPVAAVNGISSAAADFFFA